MNKKYLSELLTKEELMGHSNTLVISPCGSGKTHFIFNVLGKGCTTKILYLCDTTNLKNSLLYTEDKATKQDISDYCFIESNIQVMTYKALGMKLYCNNISDLLDGYDMIVCDEVHNLVDYESFTKKDRDLVLCMQLLFNKQQIPIIMFTATPFLLFDKNKQYANFLKEFEIFDFSESKEIKRYLNIRKSYISHLTQIQTELHYYEEFFKYGDGKALIFCPEIKNMKTIEQMALNEGLNPICVWSEHNETYPLSDEQIRIRDIVLNEGKLEEPYNVLIINRACETGVNIYDKSFKLFISTTSNSTLTYQARSRLRMDVDLVILKSKFNYVPNDLKLKLDEEYLNIPLTRADMNMLCAKLNIKDGESTLIGVEKLKTLIKNNKYELTQKRMSINKKQTRVYIINKKTK